MTKKDIVILLCMIMIASLFAGCISNSDDTTEVQASETSAETKTEAKAEGKEPVTITFWYPGNIVAEKEFYDAAVKEFNEMQDDIIVETTLLPGPAPEIDFGDSGQGSFGSRNWKRNYPEASRYKELV